jgi:hypothetical protein
MQNDKTRNKRMRNVKNWMANVNFDIKSSVDWTTVKQSI